MSSAEILKLIALGERPGTAFFADPDDTGIADTVCAFLNTRGGTAIIGVTEDGAVIGLGARAETIRRDLELDLQNRISPRALFTLSIDGEGADSIVTVEAPSGRDVPYVVDNRVFVREGRRTVPADPSLLRVIVQSRSVEPDRWERRTSLNLDEDDLVMGEVERTIETSTNSGRFKFEGNSLDAQLRELNLVTSAGLTNACDVLFSARPGARHAQCKVRYLQFETDKTGSNFLDDAWFDEPLVQIYEKLMDRVAAHARVQAHFAPGQDRRYEQANYAIEALREGIVNALAHRDYSAFSGGMTVSVYPKRIEIWNSGGLPKGITINALKSVHPSIPTNPDISHVLYLRQLMERVGRGTQKIVAASRELGARLPKWEQDSLGITLTIYSARGEGSAFNLRQSRLMESLRSGDMITSSDYIEQMEISERQARRDLADLEEAGYLLKVGQGRATLYQRTARPV